MQYIEFKNLLADIRAAKNDPDREVRINDAVISVHEFDHDEVTDGGYDFDREDFTPAQWAKVQAVG